jgi:hypothetical protein
LDTAKLVLNYVVHILVNVLLFLVLAAAAWGVGLFTDYMGSHAAPPLIVTTCHLFADLLFFVDVLGAVFLIGVMTLRFLREVWELLEA